MGLEDHVNFSKSALLRGGQRGADFGGMMSVVVDDADASGACPRSWKRRSTPRNCSSAVRIVIGADVKPDSDRDRSGRVQNVVHSRYVQAELAEILCRGKLP